MFARLMALCLLAASSLAQTSPASRPANSSTASPACSHIGKDHEQLQQDDADRSIEHLAALQSKGENCLKAMFARLDPAQRTNAENALRLYQKSSSVLTDQIVRRDVAAARAESAQEMKDGASQLTAVVMRLGLLSYHYNQLLDDMSRYIGEEQKFRQTMGTSSPSAAPAQLALPDKVELLNCHDFHVGHYDACWPPDYDD